MNIYKIEKERAQNYWIAATRLNAPYNLKSPIIKNKIQIEGAEIVTNIVEQLGYVQIDTINVIERCHHHILFNRFPQYRKHFLQSAQSEIKSVFEYWTHALSFVPTIHYSFFKDQMNRTQNHPGYWHGRVSEEDLKKVRRLLKDGPLCIRDIKDDELKEKAHEWDSKKPSKRALQYGFYTGEFVVSRREGMTKYYDTAKNHFGWKRPPKVASKSQKLDYLISRALKSQGIVSLDSICYLNPKLKSQVEPEMHRRTKQKTLVQVELTGMSGTHYWLPTEALDSKPTVNEKTHILSPFDPLIIQRKRLRQIFDFEYVFEAYVPAAKRKFGYFTLPVLNGKNFIALLDLKADRSKKTLQIQSWHWLGKFKSKEMKQSVEVSMDAFEKFQFGD